jgi:hypothetical protein
MYLKITTLMIFIAILTGCAILNEKVEVKGIVHLSDNPSSGHQGVTITNGFATTTSNSDGSFSLVGKINGDTKFELSIYKTGYSTQTKEVTIPYMDKDEGTNSKYDEVIDVGTIVLTKL